MANRSDVLHLLAGAASPPIEELFEPLLGGSAFTLERIVSYGHTTEPGKWYDQERDEWVVLLRGEARMRFESEDALVELKPGDALNIAAHCRHRVEWTQPGCETVWLALHYDRQVR